MAAESMSRQLWARLRVWPSPIIHLAHSTLPATVCGGGPRKGLRGGAERGAGILPATLTVAAPAQGGGPREGPLGGTQRGAGILPATLAAADPLCGGGPRKRTGCVLY